MVGYINGEEFIANLSNSLLCQTVVGDSEESGRWGIMPFRKNLVFSTNAFSKGIGKV